VPAHTAGAGGKQTGNHGIMGGSGGGPISNTTTTVDRATDITALKNMETETLRTPDSAPMPQEDEIGQRGEEAAPAMEEERVLEPTTDTAGERPNVEGRRRTICNNYAAPPWERLEDRMEKSRGQQPVRRQPGNEENGRPIRDNMDVEGVTLERSTGGTDEGRLAPQDRMQETATANSPRRPKKLKIGRKDETPPVRRRSRSRITGITSL